MEEIVRSNEELSKHCQVQAAPLYVYYHAWVFRRPSLLTQSPASHKLSHLLCDGSIWSKTR
jgi:hypothetical protein